MKINENLDLLLKIEDVVDQELAKAFGVAGVQKPLETQQPLAPTRNQLQPQSSNVTPEMRANTKAPKSTVETKNKLLGQNKSVLGQNKSVLGQSKPVLGQSKPVNTDPVEKDEENKELKRGVFHNTKKAVLTKKRQAIVHKSEDLNKAFVHKDLFPNTAPKVKLNPEHGKMIADAYEQMPHNPDNARVKSAYGALINETKQQYQNLLDQGFKFSKIQPNQENPYKDSTSMHQDIGKNKHLHYFPTESGFGTEGSAPLDHPMLQPTEFKDPEGKPMLANDLFRVVHDINGHHVGGQTKFGPTGEHQAYLTHKKMYSPEAQKALATETMGQNSVVNFGKHGEANRKNPQNTTYADQKAGLLPDHIINTKWHGEE